MMATVVWTDAAVFVGSFEFGGSMNTLNLDFAAEMLDVTTFGQTTRINRAGLFTVQLDEEGFWENQSGTDGLEEVFFGEIGQEDTPISVGPYGDAEFDPIITFQSMQSVYSFGGSVGEMAKFNVTAMGRSQPTWGNALLDAAQKSATGSTGTKRSLSPAIDVSAAIHEDNSGSSFTDETADANSLGGADVAVFPAAGDDTDDAFYIGSARPFRNVFVDIATAGAGDAITAETVWEYYNGTAWVSIQIGDVNTLAEFTGAAGAKQMQFVEPEDWATTTVNAQGPFFYIRLRCTADDVFNTTSPVADQVNTSIYQRLVSVLHVVAFNGTTLDLDVRGDELVGFASPTTLDSFTQATGITSELLDAALPDSCIERFFDMSWTFVGTSFTALGAVGFR